MLLLHLSVVVLGHYGLHRAEKAHLAQEDLRAQMEAFNELDRTVAELERNVLLFAFSGYEGPELSVAKLQQRLEKRLRRLQSTAAHSTSLLGGTDLVEQMMNRLERHRETFAAVVVDRAKRRRLVDQDLRRAADRFEEAYARMETTAQHDNQLLNAKTAFVSAQLEAYQFVRDPDSAHFRAARQQLGAARQLLAKSNAGLDEQIMSLGPVIDSFEQSFIQMVQSTRGYLHLVNVVLAGESEEFLYLSEQARLICLEKAQALSARIAADANRYRTVKLCGLDRHDPAGHLCFVADWSRYRGPAGHDYQRVR